MLEKNSPYQVFLQFLAMAAMAFSGACAHANLVLYGTRVVFPAQQAEVTLKIENTGDRPVLAQAWLDNGSEAPGTADVPFVVAPSLTRMEAKGQQMLRIVYSGQALPADRESLFWLNVLDIPPKDESRDQAESTTGGFLGLAFRTRIKLMYRPKGLPGRSQDAPEQLQWSIGADASGQPVLRSHNATAYVVNLGYVALQAQGKRFAVETSHVLPGETASLVFSTPAEGETLPGQWPPGTAVVYTSLDDWGGAKEHKGELATP